MPKLPHVSGAAVVRALERLGFENIRQSGSHVIMRRGSKGCVVPMHSEIKVFQEPSALHAVNTEDDLLLQDLTLVL